MSDAVSPGFGSFADGAAEAALPLAPAETAAVVACAEEAVTFLKAMGHEGRLLILCHLAGGEKSVAQLETLLSSRQAAVSQQLARLRLEGLVQARRDGQQIYYSLLDGRVREIVRLLDRLFAAGEDPESAAATARRGD
ncbi:helix-turn-helix transcriptional regulator [Poseidonocella sp. HB161398]|uniref:ArsR/SmtB family transcription factor n=1 Tax=Poseidonocella sp. HB161398 TaxID=2320855 RepID=UPI0011087717|nr:metalloregulator ArsR/SmtB family transcription factor [Poseidonocella sp. HB161398]